jgi:hypothetical protein
MAEWLLYSVPWWFWACLGLVAVLAVARIFGFRVGVWVLGLVIGLVLLMRARQVGFQDRVNQQKEERADAVINRRESDSEIDEMGESARNAEFDGWMRDKPG